MSERPDEIGALPAGLYFVATPIGNARDVTLRALDIFRAADVLAAEDTRSLRRLLEIHGVPLAGRRVVSYHDHSGDKVRRRLLAEVAAGRSVAYASEAGTPLVADPGFALGRDAIAAGHMVTTAPGPVAAIAALTLSGLPSDRFTFAGFAPAAAGARARFLEGLSAAEGTILLYESPRRLGATLAAAAAALGAERPAAVCREITKRFEETRRGSLGELAGVYADAEVKGEIVLCIGAGRREVRVEDLMDELREAMGRLRLKEAAREVADRHGVSRRDLYQAGLDLDPD